MAAPEIKCNECQSTDTEVRDSDEGDRTVFVVCNDCEHGEWIDEKIAYPPAKKPFPQQDAPDWTI